MNCTEFQELLPEEFEGGRTAEQESHLKILSRVFGSGRGPRTDRREARQLQEVAEPSPRVWNCNRDYIAARGHHP